MPDESGIYNVYNYALNARRHTSFKICDCRFKIEQLKPQAEGLSVMRKVSSGKMNNCSCLIHQTMPDESGIYNVYNVINASCALNVCCGPS